MSETPFIGRNENKTIAFVMKIFHYNALLCARNQKFQLI